ncbi:MAG TPA: ABC transporter substrate-binding protein [Candidatus Hydrogenedentes bacterium]|nr:ABC transporter substrate-binding protein [Candidatus Hydrogenedentota bacterium]HIJ74952.1 ABC transporter substrate-binding protein [Candidatus Hydrogenedentota bacterium]
MLTEGCRRQTWTRRAGSALLIALTLADCAQPTGEHDAFAKRPGDAPPAAMSGIAPNDGARAAVRRGIITFAPQVTETVFALGAGDRVAGVSSFCDYPEEVASLPKLGGVIDPDLEALTMLAPELIIVQGKSEKIAELANKNQIPLLQVDMDSLAGIYDGIARIGEALDREAPAVALETRIRRELDQIQAAVAGRPRPKVFIVTGRTSHDLNSLYTVGAGSFVSELTAIAGGDNIYSIAKAPYLEASKETLVVAGPDVIIEFHAGEDLSEDERDRFIADWAQLPTLPAQRDGRIYLITESHALRAGPRVAAIARHIASLLHPNVELPPPLH